MAATKQMILDTFFDFFGCGLRSASHKPFKMVPTANRVKSSVGAFPILSHISLGLVNSYTVYV